MVYKKRVTFVKKRSYKKKPQYKRTSSSMMVPRNLSNQTHFIKRTFSVASYIPGSLATADFWRYRTVSLGNVTNNSEISNLFEKFKISAVKWTYYPRYDNSVVGSSTTNVYMSYAPDPNNQTPITGIYNRATINNLLEDPKVKTRVLTNKPISIYYKPKWYDTVNASGANLVQGSRRYLLANGSSAIPFQGHHIFFWEPSFGVVPFPSNFYVDEWCTVYLSCKGLR